MTIDPNLPLSLEQMGELLRDCFGWPADEIARRLRVEQARSGYNVVEDFVRRGLVPFEWSSGLGRFYETTDSFVFELLIYNAQPERLALRRTILDILRTEEARRGGAIKVLFWGDGLGFDSLAARVDNRDREITSFEISELSSRFGAFLFGRAGADRIHLARSLDDVRAGGYDAVAAIDVMEHVPDPEAWIGDLRRVLKPDGVAIIKEAFDAIIPARPTHLRASAVKYAYRTPRLFERQGFETERYGNFPFVFRRDGRPQRLWRERLYYNVTTPVKRALLIPRLVARHDLQAFLAEPVHE